MNDETRASGTLDIEAENKALQLQVYGMQRALAKAQNQHEQTTES